MALRTAVSAIGDQFPPGVLARLPDDGPFWKYGFQLFIGQIFQDVTPWFLIMNTDADLVLGF